VPEIVARLWRAPHIQQKYTYNGKLVGCTPTSMAVLLRGVSLGAIRATERTVIAMTNEPVPDPRSPGWNITQMVSVALKFQVELNDATGTDHDSYDDVRRFLDEDRRILAQLELGDLGRADVPHAIEIECRRRGQRDIKGRPIDGWAMLINEPTRTVSEWMSEVTVLHAMKHLAENTGMERGLRFAYSKRVPMVAVLA
jgi:hypothetical protein